jgi:ribonucleoside-triphosphate reductase (formate)
MKLVRKRDGRLVDFNKEHIVGAIWKAAQAVGGSNRERAEILANLVIEDLAKRFGEEGVPTVEEIQDAVERVLIEEGHARTAKAFILYRKQHMEMREIANLMGSSELIDKYLNLEDWRVKENSNMAYSLQGLNNHIASTVIKKYWLNRVFPKEIADLHEKGDFHVHDLNSLSAYCVGWDLRDLLMVGFRGVSGKIESKPAKHFRAALGQIVNFFYTLQGEAAGAQAFSSFDTYLAPLIRYDNLSEQDVRQALQEFLFNINVPTRVGFQTPFTNVTLDLKIPSFMKNEPVIRGGKLMNETYSEFQKEMDLFNKVFAELLTEGDASGRVFTFPIPTYNITQDFDWESPVSEKVFEMAAKYGIPYFSNFINSDMSPEDVRSMCCRLRIDNRELNKRGGGLFGANPLTGSIGVVTVNLPRIGYLSSTEEQFYERLTYLMDLTRDSLETKRKIIERFTDHNLYPYSKFYLKSVKEAYGNYWKNHFATIGIIGMNEAIINLFGPGENITTPKGKEFAINVMKFMRERLMLYQDQTGNIYNLEATPAEGTTYRLARLDKKHYPNIIVANENELRNGAKPFYTNSSQLPVNYTDDIFAALDNQDSLQTLYTGGTVLHIFLGEKAPSAKSTAMLVRTIANNYKLPYFTLSPTFSICKSHGYVRGEHSKCPSCGEKCEVYSRIVGYLRPIDQWNDGKKSEFEMRKTFDPVFKKDLSTEKPTITITEPCTK